MYIQEYEVWLMDDEIFDMISDISEEKFVKFAGGEVVTVVYYIHLIKEK